MDLTKLAGPIIGAIIGYGTNWIAIKMLFRPLKPIKIGKFTLPFTPGIIPKRKGELAKAVGNVVGNNLVTTNDIQELLLSEKIENLIIDKVLENLENENTIKDFFCNFLNEDEYNIASDKIKEVICDKIKSALIEAQIGKVISGEGKKIVSNKVKNSMLKLFVTDDLINSIVEPMGNEVESYIEKNGDQKILPIVENEMKKFENVKVYELTEKLEFNREKISNIVSRLYKNVILNYSKNVFEKINISQIVQEKIDRMETLELEKLILSIMKKELRAIVNLGALIGLVLGSLNLII